MAKTERIGAIGPVTNSAEGMLSQPYSVKVSIEGTAPLLFHAWNVEAVAEKAKAAKGSKSKKEDNVESYVYRNERGEIGIPGEYLRQALVQAGRYVQDPRSPRKSASDLFKAGIVMQTELASLGKKEWDRLDQRRVQVQRNGLTRVRPCFERGWRASFELEIILPEYITREILGLALQNAGRLIGLGDFRPTYGRFQVIEFL